MAPERQLKNLGVTLKVARNGPKRRFERLQKALEGELKKLISAAFGASTVESLPMERSAIPQTGWGIPT